MGELRWPGGAMSGKERRVRAVDLAGGGGKARART